MKPPYLCVAPNGELEIWYFHGILQIWFTHSYYGVSFGPFSPDLQDRKLIEEWRE